MASSAKSKSSSWLAPLILSCALLACTANGHFLYVGYYDRSCPQRGGHRAFRDGVEGRDPACHGARRAAPLLPRLLRQPNMR
ncbi:hypothetical protein PR202_ga16292 [Eleusine coracana subsp. coracana]|uniref:Uncharacterized protein n=1 Tax=Eleusine coracana subsp. coracana TaxID=191504 RepID=A0AAV5CLU0_ELECO|nr:hypothetical protein PR202_ga16292 [Eleusine coracana subsp. coracana]